MSNQPSQIIFPVENFPKRGRRSNVKSKTGCLTCKARHIKCTEEKPGCKRCSSSGIECGGYASLVKRHSPSRGRIPSICPTVPVGARNDLSLTVDAALGLPSKHLDRRYLDHFRNRSANSLSRLGDQEFWTDIIVQLSVSRPTIQNAALALSAQHEALSSDGIISSAASTYALSRYCKGMKCLNQILANSNCEFDLSEVVVACGLFAAFEILQGNGNGAMRHGRGGLQVLSSQITKRGTSPELESFMESAPVKFLIRLDVDVASYGGFENIHELAIPLLKPPLTIQEHDTEKFSPKAEDCWPALIFEAVIEARDELYTHLARNYYFKRNIADPFRFSNPQEALDAALHHGPNIPHVPDEIRQWQKTLLTNMSNWHKSVRALVEPVMSATWDDKTTSKAAIMREYALISVACVPSYMSVYTCLVAEEEAQGLYDELLPQFQCLLLHAEMIVLPESSPSTGTGDRGGFLLEFGGVIQALTFAALKCRDWVSRNHAISLLSQCGRSGGWNGQNMARLARSVVDYEERQAREERGSAEDAEEDSEKLWIPLCARVFHTELELDQVNKRVKLWMRCKRSVQDEYVVIENW